MPDENYPIDIPFGIEEKWQKAVNIVAQIVEVPAALIMRVIPPHIMVHKANQSPNNVYKVGDKGLMPGLYCETVINTQKTLLVPNALIDKDWNENPDIKLGMISYLGFPLNWPDKKPFGTICVLDTKENHFSGKYEEFILCFKNLIETDLELIYRNNKLKLLIEENKKINDEIQSCRNNLGQEIHDRTRELINTNNALKDEIILRKRVEKKLLISLSELKGAKSELSEGQDKLRSIIDNTTAVIYLKDLEGRYILVNKQYENLFDVTHDYMKGKTDLDLFPKKNADIFRSNDMKVQELSDTLELEEVVPQKDGLHTYISIKFPVKNEHGKVIAVGGISTDITERKKREKDLEISKKIWDIMKDSRSLSISNENSLLFFEKVLDDLLKLVDGEYGFIGEVINVKGKAPYLKTRAITNIAWSKETRELYEKQYELGMEFYNLETLFGEVIISNKHILSNNPEKDPRAGGLPPGHPEMKCFLGVPIKFGGEMIGMVGLANKPEGFDESDLLKIEPYLDSCGAALRAFKEYKHRVTIQEQLENANKNLKLNNNQLSSFASVTSHDLKGPIRKIASFCHIIKEELESGEDVEKYIDKIQMAAKHSLELVDGILKYSKLGKGNTPRKQIDLNQLVKKISGRLEHELKEIEGTIGFGDLPEIFGDELQMEQVFENLFYNSLKYSKKGTPPNIFVSSDDHGASDRVVIKVEDNGIGFDNKYADLIFDPFQRLDGDLVKKGSGLGLSICKKIILAHNGEIFASSKLNEGTVITLTLPRGGND